jgi:hypothetical protein
MSRDGVHVPDKATRETPEYNSHGLSFYQNGAKTRI